MTFEKVYAEITKDALYAIRDEWKNTKKVECRWGKIWVNDSGYPSWIAYDPDKKDKAAGDWHVYDHKLKLIK